MSTILAVYFCEWVVKTENSAIEDKKFFVLSDRTRAHPNNAATKLTMRSEPCEICCPSLRAPDNASLSYKSCPSVVFLSGNVISYKNVSFWQIIYIFWFVCVCWCLSKCLFTGLNFYQTMTKASLLLLTQSSVYFQYLMPHPGPHRIHHAIFHR